MNFDLDWADLAFADKKSIKELHAIFIAAPREISEQRFKDIVREYLPKGDIVLGIAKEPYVDGFEGQPQFRMLKKATVQKVIDTVNKASNRHIYTLSYNQRDLVHLIEKLRFSHALFINGSWRYSFHTLPAYYALSQAKIPYRLISPFIDADEARGYEARIWKEITKDLDTPKGPYSEREMLKKASQTATLSFDYSFQTGTALGKKTGEKYTFLDCSYNKVVPSQTYAMLHGSSRETHFSPPNDLNYYDAVHAEVMLLISAQKQSLSLEGTTLFINLLPCPTCARMLSQTDIEELVYSIDHSDGYALQLLESAGKKVRRIVT